MCLNEREGQRKGRRQAGTQRVRDRERQCIQAYACNNVHVGVRGT